MTSENKLKSFIESNWFLVEDFKVLIAKDDATNRELNHSQSLPMLSYEPESLIGMPVGNHLLRMFFFTFCPVARNLRIRN